MTGYGRAARLIDYMAEDGIVGPYNGSQAREILVSLEQWEAMQGNAAPEQAEPKAAAPKTKRNRIRMEEDDEESLAASMPEDSEAEWDEVDEAIASYDDEEEEEEDDSEYDEDEEYDEEEPEEDEDEEEEESEEDEEFEDDVESVDEVRQDATDEEIEEVKPRSRRRGKASKDAESGSRLPTERFRPSRN